MAEIKVSYMEPRLGKLLIVHSYGEKSGGASAPPSPPSIILDLCIVIMQLAYYAAVFKGLKVELHMRRLNGIRSFYASKLLCNIVIKRLLHADISPTHSSHSFQPIGPQPFGN